MNNSQLVAIKGFKSVRILIKSGVPQGSHLGPLFFIVFINDLTHTLKCPCLLYADDLKMLTSVDNVSKCFALQNDANTVAEWCKVVCTDTLTNAL